MLTEILERILFNLFEYKWKGVQEKWGGGKMFFCLFHPQLHSACTLANEV